jgi:hypothetical protein
MKKYTPREQHYFALCSFLSALWWSLYLAGGVAKANHHRS